MNNDFLMRNFISKAKVLTENAKVPEENKYKIPADILNGTNSNQEDEIADEELANANSEMEEIPEEEQEPAPETTDVPTDTTEYEPVEETQPAEYQQQNEPQEYGQQEYPEQNDQQYGETQEEPQQVNYQDGEENQEYADNENYQQQQQPQQNQSQDPDFSDETGGDPTSVANDAPPENNEDEYNSTEFGGDELNSEGDMSEEEVVAAAQETPGLRILASLDDYQYNLLNVELYKKFEDLIDNVKTTIETILKPLSPENNRLIQAKDIVFNNLTSMLNDLQNYTVYSWRPEYESNVVAYGVFMRRFRIAIDIIFKIKNNKSN